MPKAGNSISGKISMGEIQYARHIIAQTSVAHGILCLPRKIAMSIGKKVFTSVKTADGVSFILVFQHRFFRQFLLFSDNRIHTHT